MPVAITMRSGTWFTTLCRVRNVRKWRLKSPKRMMRTASTASMARISSRPVRRGVVRRCRLALKLSDWRSEAAGITSMRCRSLWFSKRFRRDQVNGSRGVGGGIFVLQEFEASSMP